MSDPRMTDFDMKPKPKKHQSWIIYRGSSKTMFKEPYIGDALALLKIINIGPKINIEIKVRKI